MTYWRLAPPLIATVAVGVGCRDQAPSVIGQLQSTWVTEPEFRFGNTPEGVYFTRPYARVDPARNRALVLDGVEVSAWTNAGDLLFVVGGEGDGPGEFRRPGLLFVHDDGGFTVPDQYGSRMTHFAANGQLLEAELGPGGQISYQGFPLVLVSARNGIFLGHASIPLGLEEGVPGTEPMHQHPVLRVVQSDSGQWQPPEPLLWLDVRNRVQNVQLTESRGFYRAQPFGDWDEIAYEPGAVVAVRRNRGLGEVDLVEVSTTGDTVWHRRLQFEPRLLTSQVIEHTTEEIIRDYSARRDASVTRVRAAYHESLYRPEYVPAVEGKPVLAASGEVWLASTEAADTFSVYYVVRRGTTNEPPRRVLLPEGMYVSDATSTHVWGFLRDDTDVPYIVGRRLVEWSADPPD
jgi:hypothetical protein